MALGGLVACSTLATAQDASPDAKKGGKRGFPTIEQQMERYNTALTLTDDQKPKVKEVLEAQQKKMQEVRADTSLDQDARREKFLALRNDTEKKMKGILTDEQFKKYQEMPQRGGKKGGKKAAAPTQ
jgi:Spy/CpxP family protein refolding chaperone